MAKDGSAGRFRFFAETALPLACVSILAIALLYVTGRPLFSDDTWWHLSLGRAFASAGPWLDFVPALHTNPSPPKPHGWLSDLALHLVSVSLGLQGLRLLHGALVASILVGVWRVLARASGSRAVASAGTALFIVFSAYRLTQLRPELLTIAATLALYAILLRGQSIPSWKRVALSAGLCAVWANLHAGFPLGPLLIAVAAAGDFVAARVESTPSAAIAGLRAVRLAIAALLAVAATLVNPMGALAYLPYFASGQQSPSLAFVADEWAPFSPLHAPSMSLPPTPIAWIAYWMLAVATIASVAVSIARSREGTIPTARDVASDRPFDGRSLALCLFGLAAAMGAVRFLWLCVFPLVFLAEISRGLESLHVRRGMAVLSLLLVPAWFRHGDWPLLSSGVSPSTYGDPYDRWKYDGHVVRFLQDSQLEGHLYNSYFMGGFLGYWLAPRLKTFIDGSLDVSPEVMDDYLRIQANGLGEPALDTTELLDRHAVDAFVGIGFPTTPTPGRPWRHTAIHLDDRPEWVLVHRSLQGAVHLRRSERNRENFARVARYYAREGLAFDSVVGLDVGRIVDESPRWAIEHGLVPQDFEQLLESSNAPGRPMWVDSRLATIYLALSLDDRALVLDSGLVQSLPTLAAPRRRRVAALLRLDRIDEALAEAEELERFGSGDALSRLSIATAKRFASLDETRRRRERPFIPAISRAEAGELRTLRELGPLLVSPTAAGAARGPR